MTAATTQRPADAAIIQHLGAAVMLCWSDLPRSAQDRILAQANDTIGGLPITGVRDHIEKLVLRHAPRA